MTDVFDVARALVAHVTSVHAGEIALVAYYGSHAKGTATATSDLDLFYVPVDRPPPTASVAFVLDGLPYDFWPVSWDAATRIATATSSRPWAVSASLVADARILYSRSEEDAARFETLRSTLFDLTRPDAKPYMLERATEAFGSVLSGLGALRLARNAGDMAGALWAGRTVFEAAANTLALVNQTYFTKGWGANLPEVLALDDRPADLEATVRGILRPASLAVLDSAVQRLAGDTRSVLVTARTAHAGGTDATDVFHDFFFYVDEYAAKVRAAASRGDGIAAGYAAVSLQEQVSRMLYELAEGIPPSAAELLGEYATAYRDAGFPDLLEPAARGDLESLVAGVDDLERMIACWLDERGVARNVLHGPLELERFLHERDPIDERRAEGGLE